MKIVGLKEALQEALLDDQFLDKLAQRLKERQADDFVGDALEVFFDVSKDDPHAFVLVAQDLYGENPTVTGQDHDGKRLTLEDGLAKQAIDHMRGLNLESDVPYWAGLKKVEV